MKLVPLRKSMNAGQLSSDFQSICIDTWENTTDRAAFDLVELANTLVEAHPDDHSDNEPLRKAARYIAVGAANSGLNNAYHNPLHTGRVAMMSAYFALHTDLTETQYLTLLCAALGHDLGHCGRANPKDEPIYNEKIASDLTTEMMRRFGVNKDIVDDVSVMIISTSPNGPHTYVKRGATGDIPVTKQVRLLLRPNLLAMTQILCDADIFQSAGVSLEAMEHAATQLNAEARAEGKEIDFNTPECRQYFLDHVVGEQGFCSPVARTMANDNYLKIRGQVMPTLQPVTG